MLFLSLTVCYANTAFAEQGRVESLSVLAMAQKVIDAYPSLAIAALKVEQAQQKVAQVNGQLDWHLQANAGVSRDPGFFLGTVDGLKTSANLQRQLENGDRLSLSASLNRSDSEMSLSPTFPNPSYTTQFRVDYRKPLARGQGFPIFQQNLNNAQLGIELANANKKIAYNNILRQVIALFYSIASTLRQEENIHLSLTRTKRLKKFIESRYNLGIAENKDLLQVLAQVDGQNAQLLLLDAAKQQLIISINRLMARDWNTPLQLDIQDSKDADQPLAGELERVKKASPALSVADKQVEIAGNNLKVINDTTRDSLDLVLYAGAQQLSGDTAAGDSVLENDSIGGVGIEYNINKGKQEKQALLKESQTLMDIALLNKKQLLFDLEYDTAELVSEIGAIKKTIAAYEKSVHSEQKKLDEADKRYRRGRIDIDRVIGFENQLSAAELALEMQRLSIMQRRYLLSVLNGDIWTKLTIAGAN